MNEEDLVDEAFMRRCLAVATTAGQRGDTAVGCVIVADGRELVNAGECVVSAGDIAGHAEIEAVRLACQRRGSFDLQGCVLYTTVEPCFLCAYAIRETRIARVVYGIPAGSIGGATSAYPILTADDIVNWGAPPMVTSGVLASECRALLERTG